MNGRTETYDVIVVGGGHAGIEAALAAARLGCRTVLVTHAVTEIGRMPCNPSIGGLGKGHLVKEIDVLGGEMGRAIDETGIHFRILNRSKGPAVQAPRAQADKHAYARRMQEAVAKQDGLDVIEADVTDLIRGDDEHGPCVEGVATNGAGYLRGPRVILCTGTFLGGLMHVGDVRTEGGREGAPASLGLGASLADAGFRLTRLKTGTPPRLHRDSIDYARVQRQPGDEAPEAFSLFTRDFAPDQIDCHVTHTNRLTHEIIRGGLDRSPLYGGVIEGTGPRYCPSIEDKIVRFADKTRHFVFLEPEGRGTDEIYVNGISTSLPCDVQDEMVHSIIGLENAVIMRYGYAVEYDSVPSWQVNPTLETKPLGGLYLAGQILGTSGYEEAAAQGLIAGINAARGLLRRDPISVSRRQGYIGVLIDDIVTKEITEPYRMFTSRAENRLELRCENAARRMLPTAENVGLLGEEDLATLRERARAARVVGDVLERERIDAQEGRRSAAELLKRPGVDIEHLCSLSAGLRANLDAALAKSSRLSRSDRASAETEAANDIKYFGYISRQNKMLRRQAHLDELEIPPGLDYAALSALSVEAREKLARMRPSTLGQASRIDGVRQADLAALGVLVSKLRNEHGSKA